MKVFARAVMCVVLFASVDAPAHAQDSAYPPRVLVVAVSESPVETEAGFSVAVTGCDVGAELEIEFENSVEQARCVQPESAGSSFVLVSEPGRAVADFTAPARAGRYHGVVSGPDRSGEASFFVDVVDAADQIVPVAAQADAESSGFSLRLLSYLLPFLLIAALSVGFFIGARPRDE